MAKIVESLKRLSVENGVKKHNGHTATKKTSELTLMIEEAVSLDKNYVLSLCGTQSEPEFRIATALSDHSCIVYSVGETLNKTVTLNHNDSPIIGIKFSPTSKNIIYTATNDGRITMCDLRAKGKVIAEFKDNTEDGKLKPLASFDISTNERLMAGGTEHTGGDAFILFWDIRHTSSKTDDKTNLLGGYWESHMDDVTCLAFHPNKSDVLASGSTDGLINVFDLTQPSEDLALTYSLNTEVAADRLGWLTEDNLWCTSHTCLQLWNCDDATPYSTFDRNHLATLQNDEADNCYFVKVHVTDALGEPFLLAGSSSVQSNRENLRCLSFTNDRLETHYNPLGNKQIVRDSWLHEKSGSLITGGENGIINIWKVTDTAAVAKTSEHKMVAKIGGGKNRDRHHRTKPY